MLHALNISLHMTHTCALCIYYKIHIYILLGIYSFLQKEYLSIWASIWCLLHALSLLLQYNFFKKKRVVINFSMLSNCMLIGILKLMNINVFLYFPIKIITNKFFFSKQIPSWPSFSPRVMLLTHTVFQNSGNSPTDMFKGFSY